MQIKRFRFDFGISLILSGDVEENPGPVTRGNSIIK